MPELEGTTDLMLFKVPETSVAEIESSARVGWEISKLKYDPGRER